MGIEESIIYILLSIWGAYTTYLVFELFFDTKFITLKTKIFMFGAYNLATEIVYLAFNIPIVTLLINIISLGVIGYVYNKNIKKITLAVFLILLIMLGFEGITLSIINFEQFYLFKDNPLVPIETVFLCRISSYLIVLTLTQLKNLNSKINISPRYYMAIVGVSAISLYVIILLISYRNIATLWRTLGIVGMMFINIGIFYLYNTINQYTQTKIEKVLYQKESEYYQNQFRIIKESNEQDKKIRHDIKNNLMIIKSLLEKEEYDKSIDYINSLGNHYEIKGEISKTGVTIIDSILNYKLNQAQEKEINYTLETSVPEKLNIDYFDIGVLLSNILDNAFEALEKIEKKCRQLKINIVYSHEALKIVVENTYDGNINYEKGKFTTTKQNRDNHGMGMIIIKEIAEKYGDYMTIDYDEKWFRITVLIPDKDLKK